MGCGLCGDSPAVVEDDPDEVEYVVRVAAIGTSIVRSCCEYCLSGWGDTGPEALYRGGVRTEDPIRPYCQEGLEQRSC